ncbi:biorientation of chromosomes in cell division protein 1-like 1 [Hippocampus zosterae]|uniref:biorientation of chromosomes in cell division protein 1-like 1 n=1 Tax=Hippocampus zosterae TaxID=109293 RepID=UPI00223CCC04|nr:biorientation of chromosomes in cell division protein 1-like 1 [Hippocampus zosterae]
MAGLPPGDPQLVSMIVNHLKTRGLFDQFRRDCLADVDTKPAYLNLKQRVDNFVSNHLSNHTWSPQLNKNQLRNNIRQLVLQSGMLEQGVDRIVAQVVDPKVNHIFRPQVEKVVNQFMSPGTSTEEELPVPMPSTEIKVDAIIPQQVSTSMPTPTAATDALSILDAITSLNQEANIRSTEKDGKAHDEPVEDGEQDMSLDEEEDIKTEQVEADEAKLVAELQELEVKTDDPPDQMDIGKEISTEEVKMEEEELRAEDQAEEKPKAGGKTTEKLSEDKQEEDSYQAKQKAKERIKEEYSLEDSDLDGLSDITVSSVHTSDLSSFEGESDDEQPLSDSSEEDEHAPDGVNSDKKEAGEETGEEGKESKPRRKAYVHKPFLYSRYYSDSDDEITVEERRRSVAKDKEERLLKRQQNRERMEEKRKQKAAQSEEQDQKKQKSSLPDGLETPRAKEARKERKVLEKKVALSRKRKLDSRREGDTTSKKKGEAVETSNKPEAKSTLLRSLQQKPVRNLSEPLALEESYRRLSGSGSILEDSGDAKTLPDKTRTHSFILDLELGSQEALRQRSVGKFDRPSRKERKERAREALSEEHLKIKQKQEKKCEPQANDHQQKDSISAKTSSDERGEKKPKGKNEKKMTGAKEQKTSAGEADEASAKRMRAQSVEKDKSRDKDKIKEKDKIKGDKTTTKSDSKQLLRPDSSGSLEDRPEVTQAVDGGKKKEKHSKDVPKRSKSHSEHRQVDKLKTENKEKTKAEHPIKNLADSDNSPKRVKPAEKGKATGKSKSREEPKSHPASKMDKKTHGLDIRGASAAGKPEKENKKEVTVKEQRRSTEEPEVRCAKKKVDRKEKKEENHEEKKATKEDRVDKSDTALSVEAEEVSMQAARPDPVGISSSHDTRQLLSDITLENETRGMPVVPPEADALLTLVDVCTSAMDARLHAGGGGGRELSQLQVTLQDADMKMKEAALTLLSMDPDSALPPSFVSRRLKEDAAAPEDKQNPQEDPSESSPFADQTVKIDDGKWNSEDKSEMDAASGQTPLLPALQENDGKLGDLPSQEEESKAGKRAADSQPAEKEAAAADEHGADGGTGNTEGNASVPPCELPTVEPVSSPQEQTHPEGVDATSTETEDALAKEQIDVSVGKQDLKKEEQEERGAQTAELCSPPGVGTEPESGAEVAKEESESSDIHEPEKNSELSEKQHNGRGGRKRKLSSQNVAAVNECTHNSGEGEGAKEAPFEETEQPKTLEVRTPRRGRSSRAMEEAEDEESLKQLDKREKTPSRRGRRPAAKGNSADEPAMKKRRKSAKSEETQVGDGVIKNTSEEEALKDTTKEATEETSEEPTMDISDETVRNTNEDAVKSPSVETIKDTSEETIADTSEESKDTSEEDMKGTSEEASQVTSAKAANDKSEDAPHNTSEETIKGTCEEAAEDTHEEAIENVSVKSTKNTSDDALKGTIEEVMEDTHEEATMPGSEESTKNTSETAAITETNEEAISDTTDEYTSEACIKDTHVESTKDTTSSCKDNEESGNEKKPDSVDEQQGSTPKKPARRGRPPKAATPSDDSDKRQRTAGEKEAEPNDEDEDGAEKDDNGGKEPKGRATTRLASRLEAERNKPSKPSTRASRQSGKDETAAGARGTRAQATVTKGARKLEASPAAVRTRGGQKSEEPPAKRGKRSWHVNNCT